MSQIANNLVKLQLSECFCDIKELFIFNCLYSYDFRYLWSFCPFKPFGSFDNHRLCLVCLSVTNNGLVQFPCQFLKLVGLCSTVLYIQCSVLSVK